MKVRALLTFQERIVLSVILCVLVCGRALKMILHQYPHLPNIINFIDKEMVPRPVDVNTATMDELVMIPYIGKFTAQQILQYRQMHGPFQELKDLKQVKGIRDKNFQRFVAYVKIGRNP